MIWFLALVGGAIMALITWGVRSNPAKKLRDRVLALGELKGRSLNDVVASLGDPDERTTSQDSSEVLQWNARMSWGFGKLLRREATCEVRATFLDGTCESYKADYH